MPDYRETYREAVTADMCDIYGHMYMQFYVSAISDSFFSLMSAVGLGKSAVQQDRIGLVAVNMQTDYLAEVEGGDVIYMQGAIVSAASKKVDLQMEALRSGDNQAGDGGKVLYVCMDLDTRCTRDIPRHLLASAREAAAAAED